MAKDNIARGLANAALAEIHEIQGIAELTTAERLALAPSNPMFVFDTTLGVYFAYNTIEEAWLSIGASLWGNISGDVRLQHDLMSLFHVDNITTTPEKQFASQAEKNKWNGNTHTYIVSSVEELNSLSPIIGDFGIVLVGGKPTGYLFDGAVWIKTTDPSWENLTIDWSNITNAPNFDWENF